MVKSKVCWFKLSRIIEKPVVNCYLRISEWKCSDPDLLFEIFGTITSS